MRKHVNHPFPWLIGIVTGALLAVLLNSTAVAAVSVGGFGVGPSGGMAADCAQVGRAIRSKWFDVQSFLQPGEKTAKRPRSRDFRCIDPYYFQQELPKRIPGAPGLRCFSTQGIRACCDARLKACATL